MSKKNRKRIQELPDLGISPEIPNYVAPMTDLEYRETMDQVEPRTTGCDDCKTEDCRH